MIYLGTCVLSIFKCYSLICSLVADRGIRGRPLYARLANMVIDVGLMLTAPLDEHNMSTCGTNQMSFRCVIHSAVTQAQAGQCGRVNFLVSRSLSGLGWSHKHFIRDRKLCVTPSLTEFYLAPEKDHAYSWFTESV